MLCSACGHDNTGGGSFCNACGRTLAADTTDLRLPDFAPSSFGAGRYQVRRFLGEGAKKRVYLARDARLGRDVAIAVLKAEALDEGSIARIRSEAEAMARLGEHPAIVAVHDVAEEEGQPYIVCQYIAGGTLAELLEKSADHRLGLGRTLRIVDQVCQALERSHAHRIVHRDVKPSNVWLTSEGFAKLGDFGLAVAVDRPRLTQEGTMVGTLTYMPPEQAFGQQPTPRSDLYSLGVILYEMVAGRPPFVGDAVSILLQHVNAAPVAASVYNPGLPSALDTLILELLAKKPEDRPESAASVREELKAIGASVTTGRDDRLIPPKHLAESRDVLAGERKQVTVLFADLKDSTELMAGRDPEEAEKILDRVIECMMEAVHHYEGTVNQVRGDGIMALFGAPVANEDHALRACYAALRMQESIGRYAGEAWRAHGVQVRIRVGLNSGEVVVRSIGNDLRMEYTAIGETVHLAARMEQLAEPGTIRLTGETLRLAERRVQVKPLGPIPVRGFSHPVEVYEAIGPGSVRTRFEAAAARGLTTLVGRDTELEQLRSALGQAGQGRGQIVGVVGEAGVGKSRLLHEFTHSQQAGGWLVLGSRSISYGKAISYLPVIELLKAYFRLADRDDHAAIRDKVGTELLTLDPALERSLTPLLALLDVPVNGEWPKLDPPRRRQLTLDAVKRLLLRESQVQPLLLVFEDLHWIDAETQAVLDGLVDSLPAARLLLLVTYRPEYHHAWGSKTYYTRLRLDPLPPESTERFLRALLGADGSVEPLKPLLKERAGGNPLFLEECVQSLAEIGTLVGERGSYRLAHPLDTVQVPATVQAVLASRIDRLPPEEKQLLQSAAVIGRNVPFTLIREIADQDEEPLRRGLAHLQASEFLYEASLFPDLEYTFKHALTQDVAYRSVLLDQRRTLHAAIVAAIERFYPERLAEQIERLAHHALRGEMWEKAVGYCRRSAQKAGARSAYREALAGYEQALVALAHLPEDRSTLEQAVDLRLELNFVLPQLGELSRAIKFLSEAEPLAEALGDRQRLARLLARRGRCLWAQGRYELALESGRRALDIAIEVGDRKSQIELGHVLGMIHYTVGDFGRAIDIMASALRLLDEEPLSVRFRTFHSVFLRVGLALSFGQLGRLAQGLENAEEALRVAEATGDLHDLSIAHSALGFVHVQKGEFGTALRILERGLEICERAALAVTLTALAVDLGRAYAYSGRADEGVRLIEQSLLRAGEVQVYAGDWQTHLADAHLRAGHLDEARRIAEKALDLSRTLGQRGAVAQCLHLLGDVASSQDPPDLEGAEVRYREAMARAEELGMRLLLARCHLSLGELKRRTGERAAARQHLEEVAPLLRDMGARFWLEKAEAEARAMA